MEKELIIILDPAHGYDVKGKCSPDGAHKEYLWSRERIAALQVKLANLGYKVFRTTYDNREPGLSYRKKVANNLAKMGKRALLITLHNNGAGNGADWTNARGAEVYTSKGVTNSDKCADIIIRQLQKDFPNVKMRLNVDKDLYRDKEENFTVLMGNYMAVYIEWLFQDNKDDVKMLMDDAVNAKFEDSIVSAIDKIEDSFK